MAKQRAKNGQGSLEEQWKSYWADKVKVKTQGKAMVNKKYSK